jgi:hypothetical protein
VALTSRHTRPRGDNRTAALPYVEVAFRDKLLDRRRYGAAGYAERIGESSTRRKMLTRLQQATGDLGTPVVAQLVMKRSAGCML